MDKKMISIGALLVAAVILIYEATFTLTPAEQGLVLQFGDLKKVARDAGLHWKIPFIQNVEIFDKRIMDLDINTKEVIAFDKERLVIDSYTRYKIIDPYEFYIRYKTTRYAEKKLENIVSAVLLNTVGQAPFKDLLSDRRAIIVEKVKQEVSKAVQGTGLEIVDVRFRRADLPKENSEAVYQRMSSERNRIAKLKRAEGAEKSEKIKANADRQSTVIRAQAEQEAQILQGIGDAEAADVYAQAYSSNPDFYQFYRSLLAYQTALADHNTSLVLSPKSGDFFKFFSTI